MVVKPRAKLSLWSIKSDANSAVDKTDLEANALRSCNKKNNKVGFGLTSKPLSTL